jgi:Flp pilus assembly protein TadG
MSRAAQKGAQAVEFALVLPFLALVMLAVLDFGIVVYDKAVITNASREAARRAVVLSAAAWDPDTIRQVACDYAKAIVVTVRTGTRTPSCDGTADPVVDVSPKTEPAFNTPVRVTVSYEVRGFSLGSWWSLGTTSGVGSPLVLSATTEMNHE